MTTNNQEDRLHGLILLPRLQVQGVNAASSPLTWGFPATSAFVGFVDVLAREFRLDLGGVGIVCHKFSPNTFKDGYYHRPYLARHPIDDTKRNPKGNLKHPSIIEEFKAYMQVSLLIGVHEKLGSKQVEQLLNNMEDAIQSMRLAGGSLLPRLSDKPRFQPKYLKLPGDPEGDHDVFKTIYRRLLPGFALVNRQDLLQEHLEQLREADSEVSMLDAMLDLVAIHHNWNGEDKWEAKRAMPGWLVPIPMGYGSISQVYKPGVAKNVRDRNVPFRFVECLYGIGEWLAPNQAKVPQELLWYAQANQNDGLYTYGHAR